MAADPHRRWTHAARRAAHAAVAALGVLAIVASGGGGVGFPPCTASFCSNEPYVPPPIARVRPAYTTAQVGQTVRFSAETRDAPGTLAYQWLRSNDGGGSYTPIAGATGPTLTLPPVNLADDGARFLVQVSGVQVKGLGTTLAALGQLAVSATPGVVFADGEFQPGDWVASSYTVPGVAPPVHSEARLASGGNPGAFREMTVQIPQGTGGASIRHLSSTARYDPALQGAIRIIDYAEDCIAGQLSDTLFVESHLLFEQAGRRYLARNTVEICNLGTWHATAERGGLRAEDFDLVDGATCPAGTACPDFSAAGAPLQFGYQRVMFAGPGDSGRFGIDNWSVTVWRH